MILVAAVGLQAKQLKWKLSTRRQDAAGDGFADKHLDLTPEQLKEHEQHLVQQVKNVGDSPWPSQSINQSIL